MVHKLNILLDQRLWPRRGETHIALAIGSLLLYTYNDDGSLKSSRKVLNRLLYVTLQIIAFR